MVWYSHFFQNFPQFIVIDRVKDFGIVNNAEIDAFLELSCFFRDPADVGNLIYDSSAFSKTSLDIWKFMLHILVKLDLENFEHYLLHRYIIYSDRVNPMAERSYHASEARDGGREELLFIRIQESG